MPKSPISKSDLESNLKKMGYSDVAPGKNKKTLIVFLDDGSKKNRVAVLQKIASSLSASGAIADYVSEFDRKIGSTVGYVDVKSTEAYGDLVVLAKAKGKTGEDRPGVKNELKLQNTINRYVKQSEDGYITVEFRGGGKTMTVSGVFRADRIGDVGGAKGQKSDVTLFSRIRAGGQPRRTPISLKEKTAGNWASSDGYWNPIAGPILEHAVRNGMVKVTKISPGIIGLLKEIYVTELTKKEKEVAVFGADIVENKGAIIKKSFEDNSFEWNEDKQLLVIRVDFIWRDMTDIPANKHPALIIRNDKGRGNVPGYKGARPVIVPKDRTGGATQVRVKRGDVGKTKPKGKK